MKRVLPSLLTLPFALLTLTPSLQCQSVEDLKAFLSVDMEPAGSPGPPSTS